MPIYEYRCKSCNQTHEIEHGFHDERPRQCPACSGSLVRVFHPVGVVFKGSGFHKTDYARSGVRKEPAAGPDGKAASTASSSSGTSGQNQKSSAAPAAGAGGAAGSES